MKKLSLVLALLLCGWVGLMAQRTITGSVTDAQGEALIGATVLVQGTTSGTITDIDGNYSIALPADQSVLVFSYTGFASQEVQVGASTVVDVELEESASRLSEVVIIGYGSQTRERLTSSIASVGAEAFNAIPATTVDNALAGRLPGVFISQNSGSLGAQSVVRVRGPGSITADNQPLYVIDGLIINSDLESQNALGGPGTSPLANLNPSDIESVDVLKDAAAAAIYGARGSNGVILITTKSGKYNQAPTVNINTYFGSSEPTAQFDLLNGEQYVELYNRGQAARERLTGRTARPLSTANIPNTDWIDLVSQRGQVYETNLSVGGGTQSAKYFIGGSYRNEEGWVKTTRLQRYNFRLNLEQILGDKWTVGLNLNPSRTINNRQNEDNNVASPQTYAVLAAPNVAARDENGNVLATGLPFAGTPLSNIEGQDISLTTTQLLSTAFLTFRPIERLQLRTELSAQHLQLQDLVKQGSLTTDGFGSNGAADAGNSQLLNWNWRNTLNFDILTGRNNLTFLAGFEMQREQIEDFFVSGNTFADDRLTTLASAAEITFGTGTRTDVNFVGYLSRLSYSLDNKYLLDVNARYDGSSRFGTANRYGFFPAVSAGWIVSNEPFLQGNNTISYLKLRGSFGQTGNAGIGNFDSRGLVAFGSDYNMTPGYVYSQLENPNLQWEKAQTLDFGLSAELFNSILNIDLSYFIKDTRDLLLNSPLPWTIGVDNALLTQNVGRMRNQGIEVGIDLNVINTQNVIWSLNFNGATLKNEVLELADNDNNGEPDDIVTGQQLTRVGESISSWYLNEYAGVDPNTGDALFLVNGETVANSVPASARVVAGNPLPDFQGGFSSNLSAFGFDLNIFFQYAMGHQLYLSEGRFYATALSSLWNQRSDQINAWTSDNPNSIIPEARGGLPNGNQHSTRYLSDADYLRLKNIQIGYTFRNIAGARGSNLRVYASGQNLLTFTDFEGLDPEASGADNQVSNIGSIFFSRPQSKLLTFGLSLTL